MQVSHNKDGSRGYVQASVGLAYNLYLKMRWLAFVGQVLAIGILFVLAKDYILWPAILPFLASLVGGNIFLHIERLRAKNQGRRQFLPEIQSCMMLVLDTLQIAGMVAVTGSLGNPFSVFILAPAVAAASLLGLRSTIYVSVAAFLSLCFVAWVPDFLGSPYIQHMQNQDAWYHNFIITAYSLMLLYLVFFLNSLTRQMVKHQRALNLAEHLLLEQRELFRIAAIAASTAHELGTPLTTIAVIAREVENEIKQNAENISPKNKSQSNASKGILEDLHVLQTQVDVCRKLLSNLSSDPKPMSDTQPAAKLKDTLTMMADSYPESKSLRPISFKVLSKECDKLAALDSDLHYAISNIIHNAISFARKQVTVTMSSKDQQIVIEVTDDGTGFSRKFLDGDLLPFQSVRRKKDQNHHLGLGLFVANLIIASRGGLLITSNFTKNDKVAGANVSIHLPRAAIYASK